MRPLFFIFELKKVDQTVSLPIISVTEGSKLCIKVSIFLLCHGDKRVVMTSVVPEYIHRSENFHSFLDSGRTLVGL